MKAVSDYLSDIMEYVTDIESFTEPGREHFMSDRKTQLVVIRAYEVIGEIAKRLPTTLLDTQSGVDWKAVKGFRDILIHQHDNVDMLIVWQATQKLPSLRAAIEAMLDSLPDVE